MLQSYQLPMFGIDIWKTFYNWKCSIFLDCSSFFTE